MSRSRPGVGCLLAGVLGFVPGCSLGPAGPLIGVWEMTSDDGNAAGQPGKRPDDQPRVTDSIVFQSNGEWAFVRQRVGLTQTTKGTWELLRADGRVLDVKFHKQKTSPPLGKDEPPPQVQDLMSEWQVEVVDADHLVATASLGEGKTQRFDLRRLTE